MSIHETAERLKQNVASAYGMPAHLAAALGAWVESVEERLGGGDHAVDPDPEPVQESQSETIPR